MDRFNWNPSKAQRRLLDRGWMLSDLEEAASLLEFLENNPGCRETVADYDKLRSTLTTSPVVSGGGRDGEVDRRANEAEPGEPAGGWAAFDYRLAATVASLDRPTRRAPGVWLQLAAAVLIAATAGGVGYFAASPGPVSPAQVSDSSADVQAVEYLPDDVDSQVDVFGEVAEVFEQQAGWVAFVDGRSEMGVASEPVVSQQRLLLIRLSLAQNGRSVSQTDLVIVPDQRAALDLPLKDGSVLRYHLHASDEHPVRLSLWAELEDSGGQGTTLGALTTHLKLEPGEVMPAGSLVTESGDYQLTLGFRDAKLPTSGPATNSVEGL